MATKKKITKEIVMTHHLSRRIYFDWYKPHKGSGIESMNVIDTLAEIGSVMRSALREAEQICEERGITE